MRHHKLFASLVGVLLALIIGATADQVLNDVWDSTNHALKANVVVGSTGGGGSGGGSGGASGGTPNTPPGTIGTNLSSGCNVVWSGTLYTYNVSSCTYTINGAAYTAAATSVTLAAADATLDRIDSIVVNTSSAYAVEQGTNSATPSQPSVNPTSEVPVIFVLVTHNTTTPPNTANEIVYQENTEWTCTAGTGWNCADTSNPHGGTKAVKGTTLSANNNVKFVRSSTIQWGSYQQVLMWIAPVTWNNSRALQVTLRDSNAVQLGSAVTIQNGSFGLNTSSTAYQLVAIPATLFAIPSASLVKELRINPTGSGGTFTTYVDDIMIQTNTSNGAVTPGPGIFTSLTYTGTLSVQDIPANNASFTVSHRVHYVTTGSGADIVATMPTSPAIGDTYTVVKADSGTKSIIWTRAGSQTLNGATTRTVGAQYGIDTCTYMAPNAWLCQGNGG